ncbi:MAG: hypothetical protein M3362_21115, partial [Acidobacteriota bacterium]|nr:hypothetical protein [Acidobacteriota bacterium]
AMRLEEARHPFSIRSAAAFLVYFFLASPMVFIALPVAGLKEWRANRFSEPLALASVGFIATLLLLLNYSTTINWRYLLTGLPALAPLAASYFMRSQTLRLKSERQAFLSVIAGVALIAVVLALFLKPSRDKFIAQHAMMKDYRERLALVPAGAVVIPGSQSIAVTYWSGVGSQGRWDVIGAGSGWPGAQLTSVIEKYLAENRRVFLDRDARLWPVCGWQEAETRELVSVEPRFHFRRISDTIYELRPPGDATARDAPDLKNLLPENRPDDVERCAAGKIQ